MIRGLNAWMNGVLALVVCAGLTACKHGEGSGAPEVSGIRGRVVGPDGPLDDVRVTTDPATDAVLTFNGGGYLIRDVAATRAPIAAGTYELHAFKQGWKPFARKVNYEGGAHQEEDIQLIPNDPNSPVLEETDVPDRRKQKAVDASGRAVSGE